MNEALKSTGFHVVKLFAVLEFQVDDAGLAQVAAASPEALRDLARSHPGAITDASFVQASPILDQV